MFFILLAYWIRVITKQITSSQGLPVTLHSYRYGYILCTDQPYSKLNQAPRAKCALISDGHDKLHGVQITAHSLWYNLVEFSRFSSSNNIIYKPLCHIEKQVIGRYGVQWMTVILVGNCSKSSY